MQSCDRLLWKGGSFNKTSGSVRQSFIGPAGKLIMNTKAIVETPECRDTDVYFCEVPSDPCAIVMFGASGDLARRKLLPALYDLSYHACLGPRFRLLGFARTEMSDSDFTQKAGEFLPSGKQEGADDAKKAEFLKCLRYFSGNYDDPEAFRRLAQRLDELDGEGQLGGNRLFYLATPPEVYLHVIEQLKKAGLNKPKSEKSWTRIIIEKPFGHDLASAKELNKQSAGSIRRIAGVPH